jgi:1-deoxy-D-xylulose-5-phosphate reductoisomerase
MSSTCVHIAVLGSTGSIGRSALEVIAGSEGRLRAWALAAHSNTAMLEQQAIAVRPRCVVVTDTDAARRQDWSRLPAETELLTGHEALTRLATEGEVQVVLSAIVGRAGLEGTWAAVEAGKTVALANKESLVIAGPLVTELALERGAKILPVDSEHSAVFQCLQAGRRDELRRVVLTASGGPFRTWPAERLSEVTVADALAHPTWDMGRKITIDSATLMNKALEIVEARWLFDLQPGQIGVVIHPQSIVHSLVEYIDGSVVAQLSPPDMRLPIQYALTWPERRPSVADKLDWSQAMRLEFEPPDGERFAALRLGLQVARDGGTAGAVLNGANEAAVGAFLDGKLGFHEIVPACERILNSHSFDSRPSLDRLLELDRWARQEVARWVHC